MSELINCKICGRLFMSSGTTYVCMRCVKEDELIFQQIKDYLQNNPYAKIFEVATDLNLTLNTIKRYLKDSRLEVVEAQNDFLTCEICGLSIRSGKYCDKCYRQKHMSGKAIMVENTEKKAEPYLYFNHREKK